MAPKYVPVVLLLATIFSTGLCKSQVNVAPPMVAFMCNKPAMYLTEQGWVRDETTDCLKKPAAILSYCKEVYPDMDITNVVEATEQVAIDNWCSYDHEHCKHHGSHKVRPFRCLIGPFQSDALLVPEHCIFDHIHDSKQCKSFTAWNDTGSQSCDNRGMELQSFAILLPCGIDLFSGVEFVCCPGHGADAVEIVTTKPVVALKPEPEQRKPDYIDYKDDEKATEKMIDNDEILTDKYFEDVKSTKNDILAPDAYDTYMKNPNNDYFSEHDYFNRAKGELQKHHHEAVTKMMKEWAAARRRVQDMKATDPKASEKLNKEVTARFQKTYQALEQEEMAEKDQLNAVHQQRIQADLNDKKRTAMEHYMDNLQGAALDAGNVMKSLQHYIKTEQKDRMHSINHFKHLRDTNPEEADRVREQTLDHLHIIEQRIQQAIEMLNRAPRIEAKIKQQIDEWMKNFHEIDANIEALFTKTLAKPTPSQQAAEPIRKVHVLPLKPSEDIEAPEVETVQPQEPFKVEKMPTIELHHVKLSKSDAVVSPIKFDDETMEDEHEIFDNVKQSHIAHQQVDNFAAQESYIRKKDLARDVSPNASFVGIAVGSIAVFVIIVVGIVVLRKRTQRAPVHHSFIDTDPAASPEEKHVASMQMNGYENPTYRYFEEGTA